MSRGKKNRKTTPISAAGAGSPGRRTHASRACAAAAAVAAMFGTAQQANAVEEVIYDLRVVGGASAKSATVSIGAPTVNLALFAYVLDLNGSPADTGFSAAQGAWTSGNGGLRGNFTTALSAPFNDGSSQNPAPSDLDGDGDLDVGSVASASSGFWIASSTFGSFSNVGTETIGGQTYRAFQLGTGTFSLSSSTGGTNTQLNFLPRNGDALVRPHKYFKDSTGTLTSINGNDSLGRLGVGSSIAITLAGDNYTWTRGAGNGDWTNAGNWSIPAIPNNPRDSVTFGDAGAGQSVQLNGNKSIGAVTFNNSADSFSFNPGTQAGSQLILNNGSGVGTITQNGSASVVFNPTMGIGGNVIDVNANNSAGLITIAAALNATTVNKNGAGTLALGSTPGGVSNFRVNDGVLRVSAPQPVQNSTFTLNGGTLELRANASTTFGRPVNVTANSTIWTSLNAAGPNDGVHSLGSLSIGGRTLTITGANGYDVAFDGPVTLTGPATFNVTSANTDLRFAGVVSGSAGIVKSGGHVMVLEGLQPNTFTGATFVNGGTLQLNKPAGVNAVGGNVTVNNTGTLLWNNSEQIPDSASLTLNAGGTVNLNGFTETVAQFVDNGGTQILAGGQLVVTGGDIVLADGTTIASDVSLGRDVIYSGTTTTAIVSGNIALANNNVNHTFNVADGAASTDVAIAGVISGATNIVKTGAGTLSFEGGAANTYTGATTVSDGALHLAKLGAQSIVGPLEVNGAGVLRVHSADQIGDGTPVTLNGDGLFDLGGHAETIGSLGGAGGSMQLGGGDLTVNQAAAGTFGGVVAGNGSFNKLGLASLTLAGTNTFTGSLAINQGALRVASDANLGAASVVFINPGGTLATSASFTTGKTLNLGEPAGALPLAAIDVAAGTTFTATGSVGAGGQLRKVGPGTVLITGSSDFTAMATMHIDQGTIAFAGDRTLWAGHSMIVNADGTLDLSASALAQRTTSLSGSGSVILGSNKLTVAPGSGAPTFSGPMTGAGSFAFDGTTSLTLGGPVDIGGTFEVANGTVTVGGAGSVTAGGVEVNSASGAATLDIDGAVYATDDVMILGNGSTASTANVASGASLMAAHDLMVGHPVVGPATLNVAAGANVTAGNVLKLWGANSQINLDGGTITAGTISVENTGFNWTSGALRVADVLSLSADASHLGANVTITGPRVLETGDLIVGDAAAEGATLTVSAGGTMRTLAGATAASVGNPTGKGTALVAGAGASWTIGADVPLRIGDANLGNVQVDAGASLVSSGDIFIGDDAAGNGTLSAAAGGGVTTTGSIHVAGNATSGASGGNGMLIVGAGGEINVGASLNSYGAGVISVNTEGVLTANAITLDPGNISSTAMVAQAGAVINVGPGGLSTAGNDIALAAHASTPGRLLLGGDFTYNGTDEQAVILGGDTSNGDMSGQVDLLGVNRTFNIGAGAGTEVDIAVFAAIVNGGVIKSGAGTMALMSAGDYVGPTVVQEGLLQVSGGALPAGSAVDVQNGGALHFLADDTIASLAGGGSVGLDGNTLTIGDANNAAFTGGFDGASATTAGKLLKQGTGTFDLASNVTGVDEITVNLGTLRLSGANSALTGVVNVTGTGPTQGTLSLASENLGSASLNLTGGRVRYEGSATVTRAITLGIGGGTFETVSVVNLDTPLSGAGGLTKTGPGTLALMQAATYDGATNLMEGTLQSFVANAIPTGSEIFINTGATLALGSHSQALASITGGGAITIGGANLTVGGNDATTLFTGPITGSGSFSKVGTGELTLGGAIQLNGLTTVHAGTLAITGNNTSTGGINIAGGAAVSVGAADKLGAASNEVTLGNGGTLRATGTFTSLNPIQLAAGGGTIDVPDAAHTLTHNGSLFGDTLLTKSGAGTLRLETNKTTLTGGVHVTGGTLSVGGDARLDMLTDVSAFAGATVELDNADSIVPDRINDAAMLTLGGGTLALNSGAGGMTESIGALHLASGQSTISAVSGPAMLHILSAPILDAGGALHFEATGAGGGQKLLISGLPDGPVGAWATVSHGAETRFAKYNGAEGLVALADGDYSPTFETNANVRMTTAVHNVEPVTIRTLTMSESILSIDPGRTLTVATGGVIFNGASSEMNGPVGGAGSITSGADALHVRVGGDPATISARLTGQMGLTKSGAGTLELANNTNDFVGDIHLNAGALRISDDRQLGVGSDQTVANGNDLAFNGGTLLATPAGSDLPMSAGRTLTFNGGGGRLLVNGASISINQDNQLAGAGALTKDGSGTLRIHGANGYAGPVSVNAGRLELGNVAALGTPGEDRSIITLAPSTFLDLRSDGPFPANFGNDVHVLDNTDATAATITTGVKTDGTAGQFILNDLRMGKATLATGGTGGSLAFNGIVTLGGGEARVNAGRDLLFADRVTGAGSLTKLGVGKLTLGNGVNDTAANTYAGVTNIAGGVLELNKAAGTVAIPGDIIMSGGTLVLRQPRQISDNSAMLLTGGTFDLGGQSDSIQTLNNAGANVVVNGATLTVGETRISAGTITIGAPPIAPGSGKPIPANDTAVNSAMVSSSYHVNGSTGATIVNPGASLEVGSSGLFFEGGGTPQITLVNDATQPGKLLLRGNVTVQNAGTVGSIANSTANPQLGNIDMGDLQRTFFVNDATEMVVNGKLSRGGLRKDLAGELVLTAANDYTLGTTVAGGILEARDGALGTGTVTLSGGNLNLRSNAALARFGNDVVASSTVIDIDRVSGAAAIGTFQLNKLTIGASRLTARGVNGGALEFTGTVTLTGFSAPTSGATVIENFVPVTLSNAITGTGKLTKDLGTANLTFAGAAANTYTGTTRVNAGKLLLNKPAGVTAIAGNVEAFTGGQVEWQNHDQVADTAALSVNSVAGAPTRMDLKDFHDTVASVDLTGGAIMTGTAGSLRINGGLTSYPNTNSATISGDIELPAGMHVVNTSNTPKPTPAIPNPAPVAGTAADDLVISANISGLGGITKTGPETLVLTGNNSFTGGLIVSGGTLKNTGVTQFTGNASLDVATTLDLPGNFNTAPGAIVTKSGVGALNIAGAQSHGAVAQLVVQQGTLNMNSDAGTAASRTLTINATGGTVQFGNSQHLASLHVGDGVAATVTPGGGKVIITDAVSTEGSGTLDLTNNVLVVPGGSAGIFDGAAYTGLTKRIADAYNFSSWDGPGIRTSEFDAGPLSGIATIAIATPEEIFGTDGVINGHPISATSVILAYTYAGDLNLDGLVDGADYGTIDNYVQFPGTFGYAKGDINYDGVIDGADYGIIDNTIQLQGAQIPLLGVSFGAAPEGLSMTTTANDSQLSGVSAVPEPSACGFVLLAAGALLGRRRRRRHCRA